MHKVSKWVASAMTAALLVGCSGAGGSETTSFTSATSKVKVATSFYAMYEFAQAVAGDRAELINLVPPGTEPHDWEPTSKVMQTLGQADLLIYNGAGMENWVDKTLQSLDNKSLTTVETTAGFSLLKNGEGNDDHPGDDHGHADDDHAAADDHGEFDPHLWLSPAGAIHQVEQIRNALAKADPAGAAVFEANAAKYIGELKMLDGEFEAGLKACRTNTFFTTHTAFSYLADRYHLHQEAVMGLAPEAEPTSQDLKRIIELAKAENIKYIFFETLVSDKVAKVIASEVGAKTLVLNPLEGLTPAEVKAGKTYLSVMRENLANLKIAMECGN